MKTNELIDMMMGFFSNPKPSPKYYIIESADIYEVITNPIAARFTGFDTGSHTEQEAIEIRNILNIAGREQKLYFRITAVY